MTKLFLICSVICLSFSMSNIAQSAIDLVDIRAVKSIAINEIMIDDQIELVAYVLVEFINANPTRVKISDGAFDISFSQEGKSRQNFGKTNADITIPPATLKDSNKPPAPDNIIPATLEHRLEVRLGKADDTSTIERLVKLFNMVGNTDQNINMHLAGDADFGIESSGATARTGYAFSNMRINFDFVPNRQRSVVFE